MLKTYAIANSDTGRVNISTLDESEVVDLPLVLEITDKQSKLAVRYVVKDGAIVDAYPGKADADVLKAIITEVGAPPVPSLEDAKRTVIANIRNHFDNIIDALKKDVASYEVATWDAQRIEYTAWLDNKEVSTPYVSNLAKARGMTRDELMVRVGAKVDGLATIQGMQHALESKVADAKTIEEVLAVELPTI